MLFSLNTLKTLVDLNDVSLEKLIDRLTFSGFEVEDVVNPPKIDHLIIGHVLSCVDHPDSDHLHVLKVDAGGQGILDIVCGAKNVKQGIKVILALPGCTLPNGLTIKKGVIRNVESNGMCCSLKELGIDDSSFSDEIQNGIFVVDDNIQTGRIDVLEALGFDDTYLDINILANRPDCLSYYGMAREIASLLGKSILFKDAILDIDTINKGKEIVSETERCKRFSFLTMKVNSNDFQSPKWLVDELKKFKIRSISPLVDLGNYVMKLTGQPLHIYDLDKCGAYEKIIIRDNIEQDVVALDEKTYSLKNGDLAICFDYKIHCLGGIMGLSDVEVDSKTTNIGIEAAHFFHQNVRLTSKRLNLTSDSAQLFIKKVNPYLTIKAIALFKDLAEKLFENTEIIDFNEYNSLEKYTGLVEFNIDKCNHRLGSTYTTEQIQEVFDAYNINILDENHVICPIYRLDLVEQCDLDEEIFRYYQANFVIKSLYCLPQTDGHLTLSQIRQRKINDRLVNNGFNQTISFGLISEKMDKQVRVFDNSEAYVVKNPMTKDHEYVRTDLLASMIDTLDYNVNHRHDDLALFEISQVDKKEGLKTYLAVGLYGNKNQQELLDKEKYDFYHLKGIVEDVLDIYNIDKTRYTLVNSKNPFFHKYISADILIGKTLVGTFGLVSPKQRDVRPYLLLEMDLTYLDTVRSGQLKMSKLSIYPKVIRDFSFVLDKSISYNKLVEVIKRTNACALSNIEIFDYYPLNKEKDKVAIAVKVSFINYEKTFSEEEIKSLSEKIIKECEIKLNAHLRGPQDE